MLPNIYFCGFPKHLLIKKSDVCLNLSLLISEEAFFFFFFSNLAQTVKRLSMMQETRVQSLDWEDPLEKEIAIQSSTTAWKIPWTEESGMVGYSAWGRKEWDTTE